MDGLMHVVETLKRKRGRPVRGFIANPRASVDWKGNFEHLGYFVNAHPNLKWQERYIHYACAAKHGALENLDSTLPIARAIDAKISRHCASFPRTAKPK